MQWILFKATTYGSFLIDFYNEVATLHVQVDCNAIVLFGAGEAGCLRVVAALHTDHLRQVPLYIVIGGAHVMF